MSETGGDISILLRNALTLVDRAVALETASWPTPLLNEAKLDPGLWKTVYVLGLKVRRQLRRGFAGLRMDSLGIKKLETFVRRQYSGFRTALATLFFKLAATVKKRQLGNLPKTFSPFFNEVSAVFGLVNADYTALEGLLASRLKESPLGEKKIVVEPFSPLLNVRGLDYQVFPASPGQCRKHAQSVVGASGLDEEVKRLLEDQVSGLVQNAARRDPRGGESHVKVWYHLDREKARIVVESPGEMFDDVEKWNELSGKRREAIRRGDLEAAAALAHSGEEGADESNAVFSALDYWDSGLVLNDTRNRVAAEKYF